MNLVVPFPLGEPGLCCFLFGAAMISEYYYSPTSPYIGLEMGGNSEAEDDDTHPPSVRLHIFLLSRSTDLVSASLGSVRPVGRSLYKSEGVE